MRCLLMILLCALLLPVTPDSQAQPLRLPAPDLLTLADVLPYDTLVYVAVRTDPGYIETLDALIRPLATALPADLLPADTDLSLSFLLESFTQAMAGVSFAGDVRPWLGDTAAIALAPDRSGRAPAQSGLYLSITDRAAATAFVQRFTASRQGTPFERRDTPEATIFSSTTFFATFMIIVRDDLLIVTSTLPVPPGDALPELTLRDNPDFQAALVTPLRDAPDSYNVALYVDVPGIVADTFRVQSGFSDGDRLLALALLRTVGPLAGLARLEREGDAPLLTLDLSLRAGNLTTLDSLGIDLGTGVRLNPAFASVIPADAALVWHGTQPLGFVDFLLRNYPVVEPYLFNVGFTLSERPGDIALLTLVSREFPKVPAVASGALLGLDYEAEVLNWLGGDYAFFLRADPAVTTTLTMYGGLDVFDFALVGQVFNPTRSRRAMRTLARELPNTLRVLGERDFYVLPGTIGDADMLRLLPDLAHSDDMPPFELIVAANDDLFVIGTRRAVTDVLTGSGEASFTFGQAALPASAVNTALNGPAFARFVAALAPREMTAAEVVRGLLLWVERASFSLMVDEDGDTVLRAALLLNNAEQISARQAAFASLPTDALRPEATVEVTTSRFAGVPWERAEDGAYVLGNPDAPITIIQFSDFLCPPCQMYKPEMDRFIDTYVLTGRARYEYRTLITAGGDRTRYAAQLVECAAELLPGSYYDAVDMMYDLAAGGAFDANIARTFAVEMGLDTAALLTCAQDVGQYQVDQQLAFALGVSSTPAVLVRRGDAAPEPLAARSFAGLSALFE